MKTPVEELITKELKPTATAQFRNTGTASDSSLRDIGVIELAYDSNFLRRSLHEDRKES